MAGSQTKAILIVGGSGFVGTHLALGLREGYKVFATHTRRSYAIPGVTFIPMEVGEREWIKRVVYATHPDVVIYCAGRNDLFWAEENARDAEAILMAGVANVAALTEILQPKFIYLSSCYVYDGEKGNYHEGDTVLASSVLGKTRVAAENSVRGRSINYVIIRSSPLIGRGNGRSFSFFDQLRTSLFRREKINLGTFETHSFAPVEGLVDMIQSCIAHGTRNKVLHYGGLTKLSYYEYGREFAKRFKADPELIIPRDKPEFSGKRQAALPTFYQGDFSLNVGAAIELLKIKPFLLEEGFDLIEKNLVPRF